MKRAPDGHGVRRGAAVVITVDGEPQEAHLGETVAAVLLAGGATSLRTTATGEPRSLYCGMGVCFECLVTIDGVPNTRACMTWVADGMCVEHMDSAASALKLAAP